MSTQAVLEVLRFAQAGMRSVRLVLSDGTEVTGTPATIDTDPGAQEVFLHPAGDDDTEIAIAIGGIASAELVG